MKLAFQGSQDHIRGAQWQATGSAVRVCFIDALGHETPSTTVSATGLWDTSALWDVAAGKGNGRASLSCLIPECVREGGL